MHLYAQYIYAHTPTHTCSNDLRAVSYICPAICLNITSLVTPNRPSTLSHNIEVLMLASHPSVLLLARICFAAVLSRDNWQEAAFPAKLPSRYSNTVVEGKSNLRSTTRAHIPIGRRGASHRKNQHRSAKRRRLSTLITRSLVRKMPSVTL